MSDEILSQAVMHIRSGFCGRDSGLSRDADVPRPALQTLAIALLGACFWTQAAQAFTCTTNDVNGNWNNPAIWSGCGGGIPGAADSVVIANFNRTYTVTANATAASLSFNGGNQSSTLTINNGILLTINGNVVVNAPTANNRNKLIYLAPNGRFTVNGNLTLIGGGPNNRFAAVIIGNNAASNVTVTGNVSVNNATSGVAFLGAGVMNIGGDFANGGTLIRGAGTMVYNGAANQAIGNYTYTNLTINKAAGSANLSGVATTVAGLLTFTQGNIVTGANALISTANCATSVARTSGHVVGNLRKFIPNNASNCTFEIGDNANYTPVVAQFVGGTNNGNVTAATFTPDHANLGTSGLDTTKSVNRYWTLINDVAGNPVGLPGAGFSATFNFVAGDVDVGANTTLFEVEHYAAPNWLPHTVGTLTATSTQATGITGFGDFAVGERLSGYNPNLGRFNAFETSTPAGALRGIIQTKIAGVAASIDIIHLNNNRTALDPLTGSVANRTVRVELMNAIDNSGPLDANNCRNTWTVLQTLAPNPVFANNTSRLTVTFNEPNSWSDVRVRITYLGGGPVQIGCSTDRFAIRPADFTNVSATDATWQTAGVANTLSTTSAAGTPIHKAGRPFTLRATAAPAGATNYSGSPAVAILTDCGGATACAPSFGTLATGAWGPNPGPGASGSVITNTASYDEVGSFNLQLQDQTFANVDVADTPATCSNVAPIGRYICQTTATTVGRFVPDHFTVSYNTPQFGTACGTFTYLGQPFNYTTAPVITVTAQNFANATTQNYAGANLWRLTNASLTYPAGNKGYAAAVGTVDTGLVPAIDPVIAQTAPGIGTLSFSSGTGLAFQRGAPVAQFDADISLRINIIDADAVTFASNPANFGIATAGNGIAFNNTKLVRYGRLRMSNAYGSNLLPLPVPLVAEFATSANSFALNTLDSCTTVPVPVAGSGLTYTGTGTTAATLNNPFINGNGGLFLSAPGNGNSGFADIVINSPAWLDFSWTSPAPAQQDPRARATFTQYKKAGQFIYMREN